MKRVLQYSVDICIDDNHEYELEEMIAKVLETDGLTVFGVAFAHDVTESYKKNNWFGEHFADDIDKMYDFVRISKEEFLKTYSYLTDADYEATVDYYIEHKDDTQRTKEVYEFIRQFIRK
jgi:hypothetical protein